MESHVLVGSVLILAAVGDLIASAIVVHRIADRQRKLVVSVALGSSAMVMVALGLCFLLKVIPLG